jgi:hypothetical protein
MASQIFPSVPRLTVQEAQEIFESVRNKNRPFPAHLPFQLIPGDPNYAQLSPPPFAFDGMYD